MDGKTTWVGELYNRYSHLVFGVCLKYLRNEENARDAVLAIFEKLITELKNREVSSFQHWLYAVSRNYCLETLRIHGRDEKRKKVYHHEQNGLLTEELEVISFAEMKEAGLLRLQEAIDQLGAEQRACIDLFYLKEKSYKEITQTTGFTMNEVKTHIQNGRRNLKIRLQKEA